MKFASGGFRSNSAKWAKVWSPLLQAKIEYIGNVASIWVKNESLSLMHLKYHPLTRLKSVNPSKGKLSELEAMAL